ncbi:MAG TPA: hypothetical protein VEZ14_07960 [Dehalococcoidia bacterium]|nr:hypothetical protein [Dehalococcoidia bacterium]
MAGDCRHRRAVVRIVGPSLAAAALVVATACSGGSGSRTPVATPGTPSATPVPPRTPVATPQVTGSHVLYAAKHYEMDIPAGWTFQPNQGTIGELQRYPTDVAFAPATGPEDPTTAVRTNIEVSCLAPDAKVTSPDQLKDQWTRYVDNLVNHQPLTEPVTEVTVAGLRAFRFRYPQDLGPRKIDQIDVVFLDATCRWLVRLVRLRNGDTSSDQQLQAVLASFKVTP